MSDHDAVSEDTPAAQPPSGVTSLQALQFIKDNFVIVSAAALLIGIALSTTFLAAYLSVFDWHLLWFVPYADIITFGLLAVGIASGSVTLLQSFAQTILAGKTRKERKTGLIVVAALAVVGMTLNVWGAVHAGQGYFHILSGTRTFAAAITFILVIATHVEAQQQPTAVQCLFILLLLLICAGSLGRWLGRPSRKQPISIKTFTLKTKCSTTLSLSSSCRGTPL